jgi:hypothetical protein
MAKFSTFLFVLVAGAVIAYFVSRGPSSLRQLITSSTQIDLLLSDPSKHDGMSVRVDGTVVGSLGIMGFGGFRLQDPQSGSEILVMSSGGIPANGTAISVFGKFKQAVAIGPYQYAVILQQR